MGVRVLGFLYEPNTRKRSTERGEGGKGLGRKSEKRKTMEGRDFKIRHLCGKKGGKSGGGRIRKSIREQGHVTRYGRVGIKKVASRMGRQNLGIIAI